MQTQIAGIQAQIDANTARQTELTNQIDAAQNRLEEQKGLLSANIRSMYIEGDISPLEMIASSKILVISLTSKNTGIELKTVLAVPWTKLNV